MSAVRGPRRLLVVAVARQQLGAAVTNVDGHDLEATVDPRLKRHEPAVWRPIRVGPVILIAGGKVREDIEVSSVGVHVIYLRMAESARDECDPTTVRAEYGTRVISPPPHREHVWRLTPV